MNVRGALKNDPEHGDPKADANGDEKASQKA
jgi:hypothetical protein